MKLLFIDFFHRLTQERLRQNMEVNSAVTFNKKTEKN